MLRRPRRYRGADNEQIEQFVASGKLTFEADGASVVLTGEEVDVQRIENEGYRG